MSGKSEPPQDPGQDLARWLGELRNSNGAPAYQVIIDRIRANDATSSLSMSTLTNTFKGRGFPRYETVVAIARALGGREAAGRPTVCTPRHGTGAMSWNAGRGKNAPRATSRQSRGRRARPTAARFPRCPLQLLALTPLAWTHCPLQLPP